MDGSPVTLLEEIGIKYKHFLDGMFQYSIRRTSYYHQISIILYILCT